MAWSADVLGSPAILFSNTCTWKLANTFVSMPPSFLACCISFTKSLCISFSCTGRASSGGADMHAACDLHDCVHVVATSVQSCSEKVADSTDSE